MKSTEVSYGKCARIGVRISVENVSISAIGVVNELPILDVFSGGVSE